MASLTAISATSAPAVGLILYIYTFTCVYIYIDIYKCTLAFDSPRKFCSVPLKKKKKKKSLSEATAEQVMLLFGEDDSKFLFAFTFTAQ